jgi:hypothetical protein
MQGKFVLWLGASGRERHGRIGLVWRLSGQSDGRLWRLYERYEICFETERLIFPFFIDLEYAIFSVLCRVAELQPYLVILWPRNACTEGLAP